MAVSMEQHARAISCFSPPSACIMAYNSLPKPACECRIQGIVIRRRHTEVPPLISAAVFEAVAFNPLDKRENVRKRIRARSCFLIRNF